MVYENFNSITMQLVATTFRETLLLALMCVKNEYDCESYTTSASRYSSGPNPTAPNPRIDCHSFSDEDYIEEDHKDL